MPKEKMKTPEKVMPVFLFFFYLRSFVETSWKSLGETKIQKN